MTAALIITLRETLEAALVIGIILAYLEKSGNPTHKRNVWYAVLAGILASIFAAYLFTTLAGGFEGKAEQLYEGLTMILAAGLLTWMILWMIGQRKDLKKNIENKVAGHLEDKHPMGLFFLAFVSVLREGVETVLFLQAASFESKDGNLLAGGILGIVIAVALSFIIFKGMKKVSLKHFFAVTSILLILFAGSLVSHSVHEFQEAGVIAGFEEEEEEEATEEEAAEEESNTESAKTIMLKIFGYREEANDVEIASYWLYLVLMGSIWFALEKKHSK